MRFVGLFCLVAALAFAASDPQRERLRPGAPARLDGCPDTAGTPVGQRPSTPQEALPKPPLPPYAPAPLTASLGTTGLLVYSNTSGVSMIDPVSHTISPIALNEYDPTIDPETGNPIGGPLGSEGGIRLDLALTPDGRTALISNFGDGKIFFVDLSSGAPQVVGSVQIDMFAEDIAIDPSGTWALVADGGFSERLAVLHIPSRSWLPAGYDPDTGEPYSYRMIVDSGDPEDPEDDELAYANGVEFAADGRTVVCPDYFAGYLNVCLFDPATGSLSFTQRSEMLWKYGTDETAAFPILYQPVNVSVSPDGRTVLLANAHRSTFNPDDPDPDAIFEGASIAVFAIDAPGHVVRMPDLVMPFEVDGGQSIVFSHDGSRAYYQTIYKDVEPDVPPEEIDDWFWMFQEIQVLAVNGPGQVSHVGAVRTPTVRDTSQLFGVDCLAITPDGNFLYVSNPGINYPASPVIDVIDLRTLTHVRQIGAQQDYPNPANPNSPIYPEGWLLPAGIAFAQRAPNEPPVAVVSADKAELILDIHEAATFDGSASYDPEGAPLAYAWSLVAAPAGASATLTPMGSRARLVPDADVEGIYRVGLVVNDGQLDSVMAVASVYARFYPVFPPAGARLQRLENDFIFYKEYVNRLSWAVNPDNQSVITALRLYRKEKGATDSAYALLATLAPALTSYDDKGLKAESLYTYRITSVNSRGRESAPVVLGN